MGLKKRWLSVGILIISILLIGLFLSKNRQVFDQIGNINPVILVPIAITMLATFYVNGLFFRILTKPFGIDVKEHFLLSISTSFFNLISFFSGGMGVRAVYMKKKYHLKYPDFLASLFGNYAVIILVNSGLGLITFIFIYIKFQIFNWPMFLLFCLIFSGTFLCITIKNFRIKGNGFIATNINKIIEGWQLIRKHRLMVAKLAILVILNLFLSALANWFAFIGIGSDIAFLKVLYLSVITTLSVFTLNLTPGQIGIMEGLYMISGKIVGIPYEQSLLVALALRAVNITLLAVLGPITNMILLRKIQSKT